jgi:nucleoside-diphosphate-sugar epimerase
VYTRTKVEAEQIIASSGIEYVILRLTSIPYPRIGLRDIRNFMYAIPLLNRIEFCHPDDVGIAVVNCINNFDAVKGRTLIIAGGPSQRMLYEDMLRSILGKFGLPLPPEHKSTKEPYYLDWYDTSSSQELLGFQHKTIDDYTEDLSRQLPWPLPVLMRRVIGPLFGRLIVRLI